MAQVKRHINEMIVERAVLLRVQCLQQRGGRVPPEIARQLVDLIQQHQRVGALGRDHSRDDLARHRADVGAPMAADLSLIPHTAQAQADILAVQALGNGAGNAGLANTRRADEADDLALDIRGQFADSQHFQNAVLDLFQAIVVAVQDALCLGNVKVILGERIPGQVQAGIQIGADDRALLVAALHLGQAVHFFEELLLPLLVQVQGRDLAAVLLRLGGGVVVLAQLLADHVQLLVQVVVALVFVHRFVHFLGDLFVDLQHPALPVHLFNQQLQAAQQRALVQNGLFVLKTEQQVGRDVLGQEDRVRAGGDGKHHVLADVRVEGQQLVKTLFDVADQHIHFGLLLRLCLLDRGGTDRGQQEAAVRIQLGQLCAVFALHQDADKVVRHPHHLLDLGYNAVSAQVGGIGVFHFHLFLRDEEDIGVIAHGPFHSRNALVAAHLKVKQVVGEDHKPPQGNGRKMEDIALHLDSYFFRHIAKPPNCPGRCASS